jgi:hypothetical protein
MLRLLSGLGNSAEDGLTGLSDWCRSTAEAMRTRSRASLLAAGTLELQGKLDREFHRVESAFSDKLGQYTLLHRSLDDLLQRTDADYKKCGDSPPEVPGWTSAVETIAGLPTNGDPNVQKVLDGIRKSLEDSEKKALRAYRDATGKRHKLLSGMLGHWKEIRTLMARMKDAVVQALESTSRIDGYVDEYEKIRNEQESAARALTFSAFKLFFISVLVLGIAFGGAFINFQLIALPPS